MEYNRYKNHHKILTFLKDKYFENPKGIPDLYCFTLNKLSNIVKESEYKTEKILTELRESEFINYRKSDETYKISDCGIRKQKTQYFLCKNKEYNKSEITYLLGTFVSLFAIFSFVISLCLKQTEPDKSHKIELKLLNSKLNALSKKVNQTEQNAIRKNLEYELKFDSITSENKTSE